METLHVTVQRMRSNGDDVLAGSRHQPKGEVAQQQSEQPPTRQVSQQSRLTRKQKESRRKKKNQKEKRVAAAQGRQSRLTQQQSEDPHHHQPASAGAGEGAVRVMCEEPEKFSEFLGDTLVSGSTGVEETSPSYCISELDFVESNQQQPVGKTELQ